ncbi:MAG: hypothetical protein QW478_11275 [Candidatus Micrarchaeaceae archaeon]
MSENQNEKLSIKEKEAIRQLFNFATKLVFGYKVKRPKVVKFVLGYSSLDDTGTKIYGYNTYHTQNPNLKLMTYWQKTNFDSDIVKYTGFEILNNDQQTLMEVIVNE